VSTLWAFEHVSHLRGNDGLVTEHGVHGDYRLNSGFYSFPSSATPRSPNRTIQVLGMENRGFDEVSRSAVQATVAASPTRDVCSRPILSFSEEESW